VNPFTQLARRRKTAVVPKLGLMGTPFKRILPIENWIGMSDDDVADLISRGYIPGMAGGTTAQNQVAENPVYFPRAIVVSTDQTINQNDMVYWDAVNYTLKPYTSSGNFAKFCGCAAGSNVPGVYPNPPSGVSENLPGIAVQMGGTVWLNLQANDVVDGPFQAVQQVTDAQTVTRGGAITGTNAVGVVIVPPPSTPRGAPGATPVGETVAGGSRIRVWLNRQYPTAAFI
jgi:hypothetical protein